MSFGFIFDLIIVFCIGVMLYLVARVLPKISDKTNGIPEFKTPRVLVYLEKADQRFKKKREKFLRKIRVFVLKFDNYLSGRLSRFKRNEEKNGGLRLDLEKEKEEKSPSDEISEDKRENLEKEEDSL